MDLRRKVLAAYDRGDGPQRTLADRFGLAASTVQSWLDRRRTTGAVGPRVSGAPSPTIDDDAREVLRQIATEQPDGHLAEWATELTERTGIEVHPSTVWRQARRLGLTRKKLGRQSGLEQQALQAPEVPGRVPPETAPLRP